MASFVVVEESDYLSAIMAYQIKKLICILTN
jgi:hypothetical protein